MTRSLRVGIHPNNLHLRLAQALARHTGERFPMWVEYPDGRSTAELIRAGAIDVGGTGSTPPLTAQADGLDLVYVVCSAPRPTNGAVLVGQHSKIRSGGDLRGRSIALVEGSFHTYLLALLVERAGFTLRDIHRVDLAPVESGAALRAGSVDAWVAMDPQLAAERRAADLRVVPESEGLIANRSVFWSSRAAVSELANQITRLIELLKEAAEVAATQPELGSKWLASAGDATQDRWHQVLESRDWRIEPADAAFLREQQSEADTLLRHGALARSIDLSLAAPPGLFALERV